MIVLRCVALILGPALLLSACGTGTDEAGTDAPAAADTAAADAMGDMPGMDAMAGMQSGMMDQMASHIQAMQGADGDSMAAMLPTHRQMVANMIAQMNREMRDMNMTMDAQWSATIDSLRSDLVRMPEMNAPELHLFMPQHQERVRRLMEMHRAMMPG